MLEIVQIPVLTDNYLFLIHDMETRETAIVDPAVTEPTVAELDRRGWTPTHIINTHHHPDHTGANLELKARYGLKIIGPAADRERIPGINIGVGNRDIIHIGNSAATVFFVPGHTRGHIAYHFAEDKALFCGDTLFSMGCGRLFEGTPSEMWQSLSTLMALPDDTRIYCAHEYTQANGAFALTLEPENKALQNRMAEVARLRAENRPTIPSIMSVEKETNPFLRPMSEEIQENIGMYGAPLPAIFAEIRRRKDSF